MEKMNPFFVRPRPHFYHFEKNYPLPTNSVKERVYQTSPGLDKICQDIAVPIVRTTSTRARCLRMGETILEEDEEVSEDENEADWTPHP